jgi:hypothetical protein
MPSVKRRFIESRGYSAEADRLRREGELTAEDFGALEQTILANPDAGDLVPHTGGLRKVRLAQRRVRRGKSGGVRVYYLDLPNRGTTYLLAIFGKREKSDLSVDERKSVAALVKVLKEEA